MTGLSLARREGKVGDFWDEEAHPGVLRQGIIARDGGCILRGKRYCNGLPGVPSVVLQADQLITRQNNAIFADIQVVVCPCKHCHSWNLPAVHIRKARYDQLVKTLLSSDRVVLSSYGTETAKYFLSSSTNFLPKDVSWFGTEPKGPN